MKTGHILTVGTSLITNRGEEYRNDRKKNENHVIDEINRRTECLAYNLNSRNAKTPRDRIVTNILKLDPKRQFDYRNKTKYHPTDRMPQELSYLWAYAQTNKNSNEEGDIVKFLPSDTYESRNCAVIIADVLKNEPWRDWYSAEFNLDSDYAKDVNAEKGSEFERSGFHNWMAKIKEMINDLVENRGCERILLNATGGYKGTVPYSTLMATLHREKVEIAYLFEDSRDLIFIPTYPIGLDFREWHENALRLKMVLELGSTKYFMPENPVKLLLHDSKEEKKGSEKKADRRKTLSVFGNELKLRYDDQISVDPLKVYSKSIVDRILNVDSPLVGGRRIKNLTNQDIEWWSAKKTDIFELKNILHKIIDKVGDIIWLGDKIPEMVDHARMHHHDLLEFTELFLTPILHHAPRFFNESERFILIATVLLHDCGHSVNSLSLEESRELSNLFGEITVHGLPDIIPLFTDDVRDYHQFLAGIRLNDVKTANYIEWPGKDGFRDKGFDERIHEAVILACLYHRRRMDHDNESGKKKGMLHLTGQWPGSLKKKAEYYMNECNVDLMKVVALIRLIDGCDSQARRAGSKFRKGLSELMLEKDCIAALSKMDMAIDAFKASPDCSEKTEWFNRFKKKKETLELDDENRKTRIECLKVLHDPMAPSPKKQCARLWLAAAEAIDRWRLLDGQARHYIKHSAVSQIDVMPDNDFSDNAFEFHIILHPDEEAVRKKLLDKTVFNDEPLKKTIEKEVSSEFKQVSGYAADKMNLAANYWWKDQWELRKQNKPSFPFYSSLEDN